MIPAIGKWTTMASPLVEHVVQPPINPQHMAYCPVMDLIALATVDERVHVYRLNGNEVLGVVDRHGSSKVRKITWKANGTAVDVPLMITNAGRLTVTKDTR